MCFQVNNLLHHFKIPDPEALPRFLKLLMTDRWTLNVFFFLYYLKSD